MLSPSTNQWTSVIKADGSAEFDSIVRAGEFLVPLRDNLADNAGFIYGIDNPIPNEGYVQQKALVVNASRGSGNVIIRANAAGSAGDIRLCSFATTSGEVGFITKNGSLYLGNIDTSRDDRSGAQITQSNTGDQSRGLLQIQGRSTVGGTSNSIIVRRGRTTVWQVAYNGTASFSNTIFNLDPDNPDNYTTTTEEYEEQEEVTPYVPAVPATYDEYGNELTAEVPEVAATYQTVTKTRDISTYTGPTLDVKDRLQNLISRMDAIEADEIIDDSNSSALLQLVHNLSARLDLRDQQIADLTQRIQTLELQ